MSGFWNVVNYAGYSVLPMWALWILHGICLALKDSRIVRVDCESLSEYLSLERSELWIQKAGFVLYGLTVLIFVPYIFLLVYPIFIANVIDNFWRFEQWLATVDYLKGP